MKSVEAVIFDMDGLMFDTERLSLESWRLAGRELSLHIPTSVAVSVIGRVWQDIETILKKKMGPGFPVETYRRCANIHYQRLISEKPFPVKPGLIELLSFLSQDSLKTAVATSSRCETADMKLRAGGVLEFFDAVVAGDQVANGKPAPDIFLEAARRLNINPEHCVVLEDSRMGIRGAHAAGMKPIMVPDLIAPDEEMRSLTLEIFPTLSDFLAYFRRYRGIGG